MRHDTRAPHHRDRHRCLERDRARPDQGPPRQRLPGRRQRAPRLHGRHPRAIANLVLVDGDVADPETAAALTRTAVERFGSLDLLVNNAGVFIAKPSPTSSVEDSSGWSRPTSPGSST